MGPPGLFRPEGLHLVMFLQGRTDRYHGPLHGSWFGFPRTFLGRVYMLCACGFSFLQVLRLLPQTYDTCIRLIGCFKVSRLDKLHHPDTLRAGWVVIWMSGQTDGFPVLFSTTEDVDVAAWSLCGSSGLVENVLHIEACSIFSFW